jgi:hypothetical protein
MDHHAKLISVFSSRVQLARCIVVSACLIKIKLDIIIIE